MTQIDGSRSSEEMDAAERDEQLAIARRAAACPVAGDDQFDARAAHIAGCRGDAIDDELRAVCARVRYLDLASVTTRRDSQSS